jgi:aerobic-type carbon monoxide dehydrogenase small subunit (CoxS/CutS family)
VFDGDPSMPLLWYLRDELGLTGTKFGCGVALCGACTVHVEGEAARSCAIAMSEVIRSLTIGSPPSSVQGHPSCSP